METTNINERLKDAARVGDIDLLYTLIQEDPCVLENIDSTPFVETPLHVAAFMGQLQFATELMRLKPSFAWKLNQQGFSPIHLAMRQRLKRMVLRFVDIDNDLVRVKGREGFTPLHLASHAGDVDLLARLLFACPDSIEDVSVRNETALHVVVESKQYEALQVLVGWLKKSHESVHLESTILNRKDEGDNTILHISARNNDSRALRLLVKTGMDLNAKNLENSTALDIAASAETKSILSKSGAKYGSSVTDAPTHADMLKSKITGMEKIVIKISRLRSEISEEQRNAFLVVAALAATAAFQTALSPPGGVYQADAGDNKNNNNVGKSVMPQAGLSGLMIVNAISLLFSVLTIYILTPGAELVGTLMLMSVYWLLCSYIGCVRVIPPDSNGFKFSLHLFYIMSTLLYLCGIGYKTYNNIINGTM